MLSICYGLTVYADVGDLCSVTCDTEADAEARIAATGATGGIAGRSLESYVVPLRRCNIALIVVRFSGGLRLRFRMGSTRNN